MSVSSFYVIARTGKDAPKGGVSLSGASLFRFVMNAEGDREPSSVSCALQDMEASGIMEKMRGRDQEIRNLRNQRES